MKRAAVLAVILLSALGLRAFDLQYGSLFTVHGITLHKGRPVLPLSRGKYANVRVLDKGTFEFLKTCAPACVQADAGGKVRVHHVRAAKTRPDMWIADVAVDERWLLTLLVFKHKDEFSFVLPQDITVHQKAWPENMQALVRTEILNGKR